MDIKAGFDAIKGPYIDYFRTYTYDRPLAVSKRTNDRLRELGLVLYKALDHLLGNYRDFLDLVPRDERELRILDICGRRPFRVGTFRTDFVIDRAGRIRMIEITSRQPLNGYFTSGFFREIALEQAGRLGILDREDPYPAFFDYLQDYMGGAERVCVIKGNEKLEEFKIYPALFEAAGLECRVVPVAELASDLSVLDGAWVVEELTFDEIRALPDAVIDRLARAPLHNDLLSLLHTHDKRIFGLLADEEFTGRVLDKRERAVLAEFLVPAWTRAARPEEWARAIDHKDSYIIKPVDKGKSVGVRAGVMTATDEWRKLLGSSAADRFILQPFIDQKRFQGRIGDEVREDFICGTLLYFNDRYFGPGLFRASSHPISNITDNRKAAQIVADDAGDGKGTGLL